MLSQATLTADIIKQMAVNAVNSTQPFAFYYGTVTSVDPIEIEIDQKLKLGEKQLIFSTLVQDFDVDMYMEHEVEETDLIHNHTVAPSSVCSFSGAPLSGIISIQNSPDSDKHIHEYKGVKTFTLNLKLAKDEKVLLLRIQGGQKFLVLDRVRVLNDTEFSSEFEGEGSTGSSGGSSSDSGSSDSGNGGDSSGGTDSGNGDNDSTDDTNPDSGNNNIGGAIGNAISVTALMTALLALTPEQKEEIGLSGVKIDDENISSETTYSSQKIDSLINDIQGSDGSSSTEFEKKITALLPEQASSENKLADKDFVNSSISTNTSYFIGTFNSLEELQASDKTITNNDYAFIVETDSTGNVKYNRYKWNGSEWLFEYALNNSSFTSDQWKTINSNVTEENISEINGNIEVLQNAYNNFIVCETVNSWNVIKFPKTKTLIAHRFLTIAPPPSLATTQVYTVDFPYEMSDKFFNFQYSLSINGTTISNILECDSGANNARTTKSTALFITYNSATSKYNIAVNVCVIGTYK